MTFKIGAPELVWYIETVWSQWYEVAGWWAACYIFRTAESGLAPVQWLAPCASRRLPPPTYSYIGWCPRPTLLRQSQLCLERSHHYEVFGECWCEPLQCWQSMSDIFRFLSGPSSPVYPRCLSSPLMTATTESPQLQSLTPHHLSSSLSTRPPSSPHPSTPSTLSPQPTWSTGTWILTSPGLSPSRPPWCRPSPW